MFHNTYLNQLKVSFLVNLNIVDFFSMLFYSDKYTHNVLGIVPSGFPSDVCLSYAVTFLEFRTRPFIH